VLQSVSSADFSCTSANNSITCARSLLQVGEVGTITVMALVPTTASPGIGVPNTATVGTTTHETNLSNNQDTAVIIPAAVESLAPTIPPAPAAPIQLPRTGIDAGSMLRLAALLALGGAVALVTSRRRKRRIPC
jgi:LPXTG-motif cell wall-anchored protein